jgi:hypothetical protein
MPATVGTVAVYAGDTVQWPVYTIKTSDNQVRDLNAEGWTQWQAQWRPTDDSENEISLQFDGSRLTEGMLLISASPVATRAMGGSGVWDIQSVGTDGQVKTWLRGKTKWTEDVTRND